MPPAMRFHSKCAHWIAQRMRGFASTQSRRIEYCCKLLEFHYSYFTKESKLWPCNSDELVKRKAGILWAAQFIVE